MEQQRIWDHFQKARVDSFDHARGRYVAMAAAVRRQHGRDGGRVLNISIGPGILERLLQARGWQVASLDPSETAVAALASSGFDARCGYAQRIPFEVGSFNVVVASEVVEHIEPATRAEVLAEVARVLVPGGWFVGSVPYKKVLIDQEVICPDCGKVFHRWEHVSSFDLPQICAKLKRVYEAVSCRRRSFVDWASARTSISLLKAAAQSLLRRMGEPIASPGIVFTARRRMGA